ncbi:hypothetical protein HWC07_gp017 [Pantoea phage vB_PagM_LIET2]|uniref:Uncharacterized protein n=1 Tax=Pantoea phage vB_PagM_LIET2 TaxID=2508071 RepID=A0A411AW07_9CAUD|nr:hypothetical protein HWC07_gp017 [Pantoea phage vB_PagM_LIET2]QAX92269.1 hypothetical protein LIET2_gp017 [Pantoea phage vB_PagM_LIET2]UJH95916.1 hypothetical protein [Pantoea phage Nafs113]
MKEIRTPTPARDVRQGDVIFWRGSALKVRLVELNRFTVRLVVGGTVINPNATDKLIVLTYQ